MINRRSIKAALAGGDLRSVGNVSELVNKIKTQSEFNLLFEFIHATDRLTTMRAADALEKISAQHPEFLEEHKEELIQLLEEAKDKELKWHLSQLISRVTLNREMQEKVWQILSGWVRDSKESKIVRVNSLMSLYNLTYLQNEWKLNFYNLLKDVNPDSSPSLRAAIRKLMKQDQEIRNLLSEKNP